MTPQAHVEYRKKLRVHTESLLRNYFSEETNAANKSFLTQFVENNQAPACGVVKNVRGLTEFNEERRLSG